MASILVFSIMLTDTFKKKALIRVIKCNVAIKLQLIREL